MAHSRSLLLRTIALVSTLAGGCATGIPIDSYPRGQTDPAPPPMHTMGSPPTADGGSAYATDAGSAPPSTTMPPPMPASGPLPLACGRTYDQQTAYFTRSAGAAYVALQHKDGTSLPADEGGASCDVSGGCLENVTRLADGESLVGTIEGIDTLTIQAASSLHDGVGSVTFEACGGVVSDENLYRGTGGLPGFTNSTAFTLPHGMRCSFTIRAHGGYADVRAVTTTCPSSPQPGGGVG